MPEPINTVLNERYQIVRRLGSGGMGSVYQGRDLLLERAVALKVMHEHLAGDLDFQARFRQEATTAAQFRHPGIVQVYDAGMSGSLLFIVMELIPGENLNQMLDRLRHKQQWLPLREAVELVRQVGTALGYAHKQGTLHRDIKPANIMIKDELQEHLPYRPVIADFGLAKLREGGIDTQTGIAMGTPTYMSPEQTLGEGEVDARSDIYSLGIVLYELAAGQPPFVAKSITQAVRYHITQEPPPPSQYCPVLPPAIEAIILKAIQKRPEDRYATAEELVGALESVRKVAQVDTVPLRATAGAASIVTVVQESQSVFGNSQTLPFVTKISAPQIVIRSATSAQRAVPLKSKRMKIGRNPDNDIVIDEDKVSRYHAQIDFDGLNAAVTDLGSTNRTFLDGEPLPKQKRTPWPEGQSLHVGSHYLYLQLPTSPPPAAPRQGERPGGTFVADTAAVLPSGQPRRSIGRWVSAAIGLLLLVLCVGAWYVNGQPDLWARLQQLAGKPGAPQAPADPAPNPGAESQPLAPTSTLAQGSAVNVPVGETPETTAASPQATVATAAFPGAAETATSAALAIEASNLTATATAQAGAIAASVAGTLQAINATETEEAAARNAAATHTAIAAATLTAQVMMATATAVQANHVAKTQADATTTAAAMASAATQTAVAMPTATPTPLPPTNTPSPTNTPLPPQPTNTPLPPTPIPQPGLVTSFEPFGTWVPGDEPWGTFEPSNERSSGGSFSGQLHYDFTQASAENDYVVFMPRPSLPLQGHPQGLRIQVYGDGSRNFLNAWVRDGNGTTWQFTFGRIAHQGWAAMNAPLDISLGWPNGLVKGNGSTVTYPLSLEALVLNGEDHRILTGDVFLDELFATAEMPARPNIGGGEPPAPPNTGNAAPATEPNITCGVDPGVISRGQSATLFWTITGVQAVYLGNEGVAGIDKRTVSPDQTTPYTLRIIRKDGSETTCTMSLQVN